MVSEEERQVVRRETATLVANKILEYYDKSKATGRSEHFLSGLDVAYSLAVSVLADYLPNDHSDNQETLF